MHAIQSCGAWVGERPLVASELVGHAGTGHVRTLLNPPLNSAAPGQGMDWQSLQAMRLPPPAGVPWQQMLWKPKTVAARSNQ